MSSADPAPATGPATPAAPDAGGSRGPRWWVVAITFVGGVLVGVLGVSLLVATTPDFGAAAGSPGAAGDPGVPTPSGRASVPVVAEARVNAACLRVINQAQDVYRIISGLDEAAKDVDLQRLDDIVRRLQPIEPRLARDLQACRVTTRLEDQPPDQPANPASPPPTVPQPTATPTG